jgi:hypothetical protein
MAGPGGSDLTTRIRLGLAAGKARDQVVAELVAGGLSQPTAERFVDRALAEQGAGPATPTRELAAKPAAEEDPGGRGAMISGSFWLSLGACVTGGTYLLAKPGEEFVLAYGAVIAGILAFVRGLSRWHQKGAGAFPWLGVLIAGGLPILGTGALFGGTRAWSAYQRNARRAEQERLEQADRARREEEAAVARRQASDQARTQAHAQRVRDAWNTLRTSDQSSRLCEATQIVARNGLREAIPDLVVLLRAPRYTSVQHCAASALVGLGEVDTALAFYVQAAQGTDTDLRRGALGGFGEIGPRAAPVALPLLAEALRHPHWDMRFAAVGALSKLGPDAEPLLKQALNDTQKEVRDRAARALAESARR